MLVLERRETKLVPISKLGGLLMRCQDNGATAPTAANLGPADVSSLSDSKENSHVYLPVMLPMGWDGGRRGGHDRGNIFFFSDHRYIDVDL
jgi:hypothetical protein